jgi:Ni,Fe-hydrogenase III large subunit
VLIYADWDVITQPEGDIFAKAVVRLPETFESIKKARQAHSFAKTKKARLSNARARLRRRVMKSN